MHAIELARLPAAVAEVGNLGVEFGQIAVLLVLAPLLTLVMGRLPQRGIMLILSGLIAHIAWHWLVERWDQLSRFPWPASDATALPSLLRWLAAAIVCGLILHGVDRRLRVRGARGPGIQPIDGR